LRAGQSPLADAVAGTTSAASAAAAARVFVDEIMPDKRTRSGFTFIGR
jgi:hypothetical protein